MQRETIYPLDDSIDRKIVAEVDDGKSHVEFYEGEELQLIIDIPEDVINLEKSKFKKRKYSAIFYYYLDNGIQDLSYSDIEVMINKNSTYVTKCKFEFVFHNKNGISIKKPGYYTSFTASYQETINGVMFNFESRLYDDFKYREFNELVKSGGTGVTTHWKRTILNKSYQNEHNERCVTIQVNGITYSMLEMMYNRLNSDEYLRKRNFFKKGSTLFNKETTRLFTKHIMLNRQREIFIKYVDFDGTAIF